MFAQLKRFFFQKRGPETGRAAAEREIRWRGSPLRSLDPDGLASAIESFRAGTLAPLARIVDELELRDDTMRSCSRKMRAAAARCPHKVLIREGVGEGARERAEAHRRALERLWGRVRVTDALQRNARGGMRLLLKQMMGAQSMAFAAHELVWTPTADGSLDLTLVHVPLQFFENRTGALRYLRDPAAQWDGEEMAEGEWLVTAGDGVGIAAAIAATFKRLSLQDWLLFSERCGQPGLHAATDAKQGSEQWDNLVAAVANFGREWGIVTDRSTAVDTVSLANGGTPPYPALVERMDRAIATLYRGSDLSTISGGEGSVGASQQGEEADILEQDACEMLSEALQEQVERPFIRYVFGDGEPLAYIQISPVSHPNLDMEMKIDQHLAGLGARLSKREALERYQRTEAAPDDPDDEPLEAPQPAVPGGFGLPNEAPAPGKADSRVAKPLQNAPRGAGATDIPQDGETRLDAILDDFSARLAEEMQDEMFSAAAEALASDRTADKPAAGRQTGSQPAAGEAANEDGGPGAWEIVSVAIKEEEGLSNEDRESNGRFATKGTGDQTGHGSEGGKPHDNPRELTDKDFPPPAELSPEGTPIPLENGAAPLVFAGPADLEYPLCYKSEHTAHIKERRDGQKAMRIAKAEASGDEKAIAAAKAMPGGEEILRMAKAEAPSGRVSNRRATDRGTEEADIDTEHLRIGVSRRLKTRRHKADAAFDVLTTFPPDEEFSATKRKKARGGK